MYRRTLIAAVAVCTSLTFWAARSSSSTFFHLELVKSEPAAGTTVAPPAEIRLWFTEAPEEGTASIRLLNASGELVTIGEATPSEDDPSVISAAIETPPPDGAYTVSWRGMADDGHVANEEFEFTIKRSE
jgi:copper resistance protein C